MGKKRKRTTLGIKLKLQLIEKSESTVSVSNVCEEHEHFGLPDIRQYRTPLATQSVR
jgi:hypothetical protein